MIEPRNLKFLISLRYGFGLIIFYPLVTIRVIFHQSALYGIVLFDDLTFGKHSEPGEREKVNKYN